jgi:hypothetical protein
MKKTFFLILLLNTLGFSQTKTSGTIALDSNGSPLSVNFTLDKKADKVTLVLTGPADRWFGIGIGVVSGNKMNKGDALVYSTSLSDCYFSKLADPPRDAAQDWTTISNNTSGSIRTLELSRSLSNIDVAGADFQMPYDSTNSFSVVGVAALTPGTKVTAHDRNATYAMATFTPLGVEDFSLNATKIFPVPSSKGIFTVQSKTGIDKIDIYSQAGAFVKTINVNPSSNTNVSIDGLSAGVYLIELKNDTDSSWKKVIVE